MKVVCINKYGWITGKLMPVVTSYFWGLKKVITQVRSHTPSNGPRYGDILEVVDTSTNPDVISGEIILYYKFDEWPKQRFASYSFKPIDESEETEAEEKIEELLKTNLL